VSLSDDIGSEDQVYAKIYSYHGLPTEFGKPAEKVLVLQMSEKVKLWGHKYEDINYEILLCQREVMFPSLEKRPMARLLARSHGSKRSQRLIEGEGRFFN